MTTNRERFEAKFEEDESTGCWNWTAGKGWKGYGTFWFDGRKQLAHGVAYQLYVGEIPDNSQVFHKCDNISCVNPCHLFLGPNTVQQRFEKNYKKDESSGCWDWTLYKNYNGYGTFHASGQMWLAHRFAYQLYIGEIPDGLCICHKCDNPACVNPDHLFPGTQNDNVHDCINKGRNNSGEKHGSAKLTEEQVRYIRMMWANGVQIVDLAKEFGVAPTTISYIVHRRNWAKI